MAEDPQSEFERIFGKTQKSGEGKSPGESSTPGTTQKLPTDSDLLGIRTDSDRFLVKSVPENLPGEAAVTQASAKESKPSDPGNKSSQDAMTIALNVNVFANIADAKKAVDPKTGQNEKAAGAWAELVGKKAAESQAGEATFVIPLPKEPTKPGADIFKFPSPPASPSDASAGGEFTRVLSSKNIPAQEPNVAGEFTRVLHVEDSVKLPKPNFPRGDESSAGATIAVTNPKISSTPPAPVPTVTASGPSDFTKVVKGSELRALQEKLATAAANGPGGTATPAGWPPSSGPGQAPTPQPWQSSPQAPLPQYIPAANNGAWPAGPQSAVPPRQAAPQQSMLSQYMPVLAALSVLILLAILLVVILKK